MLPSSKTIVDRSTIKSHLLSDTTDPFNRSPLSIEDVIPGKFVHILVGCLSETPFSVPELKARIDAFLREKRNKNTNQPQDAMDVQ